MGKKSRRPPPKMVEPKNWAARASGQVVRITREQALVRLLDTAVWLWFYEMDFLSIHLTASAAHKTLTDITKGTGKDPWLGNIIDKEMLTRGYDFLRHASRDLRIVLDLPPSTNLPLLASAIDTFENVFRYRTPFMSVLMIAFVICLPAETPDQKAAISKLMSKYLPDSIAIEDLRKLQRPEFFAKTLPLFERGR
jgi:hypothetical protein